MKILFNRIAILPLLAVAFGVTSCVNEEYDLSKDNLNLEVTPFQDGLTIPLGSTEKIRLKELLKDVGDDILNVGDNGAYRISIHDSFDLTENLAEMKDLVSIPDVNFSRDIDFSLKDVDVSDIRVEARTYSLEYAIPSSFSVPDIRIPEVNETFEVNAGLHSYVPDESQMRLALNPIMYSGKYMNLPADENYMEFIPEGDPIELDKTPLGAVLGSSMHIDVPVEPIPVEISLPKGINSVSDVVMHGDAGIVISLELGESFIHSGKLVPDIKVDLSSIFEMEDQPDGVLSLGSDLVLSEENGYKQRSRVYGIKSLAVSGADWKRLDENSPLELNKNFEVSINGELRAENLTVTRASLSGAGCVNVLIKVEFVNMRIDDLMMGLDPIRFSADQNSSLLVDNIELPAEIGGIRNVKFTENSGLDIYIESCNLEMMKDLDAEIELFEITFPKELHVEGADADNKVTFSNVDLSRGASRRVNLLGVDLPDPQDGKISFHREIAVHSVSRASGDVHCSELPQTYADDVKIMVNVKSDIEIEDYLVEVNGYEQKLEIEGQEIKVEIPEALAEMEEIVVYPEGDAYIAVTMDFPEIGLDFMPSSEGTVISFPEMLGFGAVDPSYNFDMKTNSLELTRPFSEYGRISLPVEKLVLTPVADPSDGKFYAMGTFGVEGGVALAPGFMSKAQIEYFTDPSAEKKVSVVTEISEFVPAKFDVGTFETNIRQEVEFDVLSAEDLPKEIVSLDVVELKDTYIRLSMDAASLPELGEASLSVDFDVDLPDIIRVSGAEENGILKMAGVLKDGMIGFEPVRIEALDLRGVDLKEGVKGVITVDGSVKLDNASLDVEQWLSRTHAVKISADISDINIAKVSGRVDYNVEPIEETIDLSDFTQALSDAGAEAVLDFNHAALSVEVVTNLSIPVEADVVLVPYYEGTADEDRAISVSLSLDPAGSPQQEVYTRYWLADKDSGRRPDNYTFVQAGILELIRDVPEKLEMKLAAKTDSERDCILEPSADYTLKANYLFELPLEFGEDFMVTYKDTISGLPGIVAELLAGGNKVKLAGEIENALPIGLELRLNFLDADNNAVPAVSGGGVQKIAPCGLDGSASKTALDILIGLEPGVRAEDVASIELQFEAASSGVTGVPVKEDAYLQAVLRAVLPEGITVDLKDFINEEEEYE